MKEPSIFSQRKDLKKRSHAVIKSHYLILVFLVLVMTLFGTEFRTSLSGWRDLSPGTESESEKNNGPGNMLSANDVISASTVLQEIASGNLASGSEKAAQNAQAFQEKLSGRSPHDRGTSSLTQADPDPPVPSARSPLHRIRESLVRATALHSHGIFDR